MTLPNIKMTVTAVWVLLTLVVAIGSGAAWPFQLGILAIGLVPALALLLFWNDPAQTMAESIDEVRRGR